MSTEIKICEHCGRDTSIYYGPDHCNHVYYPEHCKVCRDREEYKNPNIMISKNEYEQLLEAAQK